MDSGNTDPNNPNPNNPTPGTFSEPLTPSPASPATSPSFMADNTVGTAPAPVPDQPFAAHVPPAPSSEPASNWSNPATPVAESPAAGGLTNTPPQQEANPFNTPAPTAFNPFSSQTAGSTPPSPESFPSSSEPAPSETVPTDLSNLVNTTSEATNYVPQSQTPESLVVPPPQASGGDVNQAVPDTGGNGFPKIVFVIGGIILLGVLGASAYFILGIGKPAEPLPASVPAEQQAPAPVTKAPVTPASTQSGTFSNLPGNTITPTTAPGTGGTKSAYETLMEQKKSATGSATP